MELSYSNQFDRIAAVSDLRALADWLDEKERFSKLPALDIVLGPQNLGLDTDFSPFVGVITFFEYVEHRFPGVEKLALRRILKQGDQNLLVSIPKSLAPKWEGDYESLLQRIEELSKRKETFETEVKKLSVLLADIPSADHMGLEGLRILQSAIERLHEAHAELGENEPVHQLLRDRFKGPDTRETELQPELAIAKALLPVSGHWKGLIIELIRRGDIETFRAKLGEFLGLSKRNLDPAPLAISSDGAE